MNVDEGRAAGDLEPLASTSKTPGELLREERMRRKLSVQQTAEDLHLDVPVVEAIEANNFVMMGAPVYARGYLRQYAILLGLAPDVVLARYQALNDVPQIPTPVPSTVTSFQPRQRMTLRMPRPVSVSLAALLMAGAGLWALDRWHWSAQTPQMLPAIADPADPGVDSPEDSTDDSTDDSTNDSLEDPGEAEGVTKATFGVGQPIQSQPAAGRSPTAGADFITLRLEFESASWAEIYDATGERLMYDIGQPGQTRTVSGLPPLQVVMGVAAAVSVRVNDVPTTIPRQSGRDAARFMVAADGSMR